MDDLRLRFYNPQIGHNSQIGLNSSHTTNNIKSGENSDFAQILQDKLETSDVSFSKHATKRVFERNIDVSAENLERLNQGVKMAESKNLEDALILVGQTAFIVNVPSNTVITTTDSDSLNGSVFTNINGTVII